MCVLTPEKVGASANATRENSRALRQGTARSPDPHDGNTHAIDSTAHPSSIPHRRAHNTRARPRLTIISQTSSRPCGLSRPGLKMGGHWHQLREYFHHADLVIGLFLAVGLGYFLWSHWPKRRPSLE